MKVLLTGASGIMGLATLKFMTDTGVKIRAFCLDDKKELKKLEKFKNKIEIFKGDVSKYDDIFNSLDGIDIVFHMASIIPPKSEEIPKRALEVNYGSTKNIVDAIIAKGMQDTCKLVYISSVAVYGDRQPPIHWGRVGDPIKISYMDYYGISKVLSERYLIESPLKNWAILRQTGIISHEMLAQRSSLIFHQPLNNALEYISDRDSGRLLSAIASKADDKFWNKIYNIGGGEGMRMPAYELYKIAFSRLGFKDYKAMLDPKLFALYNFHGIYYLDSDELNNMFHYVKDDTTYIYECTKKYTKGFDGILNFIMKFPPIQYIAKKIFRKQFENLSLSKHGPLRAIRSDNEQDIDMFFSSKQNWEKIPYNFTEPNIDYSKVIPLNHGFNKAMEDIDIDDVKSAAEYRGGKCLDNNMVKGDLKTKLHFVCAENHEFEASPMLVLFGGQWCPHCENIEWNPAKTAEKNKFFAQVWYPLHNKNEKALVIPKAIKYN